MHRLQLFWLLLLLSVPTFVLAGEEDICSPEVVLNSFNEAALAGNVEDWLEEYENSDCPASVIGAARELAEGYWVLIETQLPLSTALEFDGADDYVEIPHEDALGLNELTVEFLVYPREIPADWLPLVVKNEGFARNYAFYLVPGSTQVHFSTRGENCSDIHDYFTNGRLQLNAWNHVAVVYDGDLLYIYLNGDLDQAQALEGGLCQNTASVHLGYEPFFALHFNGYMAEVRIWNIARDDDDIEDMMNLFLSGDEDGLVGYWHLFNVTDETIEDVTGTSDGILFGH